MTEKNYGFTTLFKNHVRTRDDVISYHCIIHQKNLVALHSDLLEDVMKDVILVVNFIRSHALEHRQYNVNYGELVYYCQVRWMSKGLVLERFFHLLNSIREYLSERDSLPSNVAVVQTRLGNSMWIEKVAFLTDITAYLNKLNW